MEWPAVQATETATCILSWSLVNVKPGELQVRVYFVHVVVSAFDPWT